MFNNELMADVHFKVVGLLARLGGVPAHKVGRGGPVRSQRRRAGSGGWTVLFWVWQPLGQEGPGLRPRSASLVHSMSWPWVALSSMPCFTGDLAEVKSEIHIPDVEPAAFLILLK